MLSTPYTHNTPIAARLIPPRANHHPTARSGVIRAGSAIGDFDMTDREISVKRMLS